ncbi:MAG: glutamate synthase subunit beta, partial [bacterium]
GGANMGKDTGFLEYRRKDPHYRPKDERIKDFAPVELPLMEAETVVQAARCMDCGTPFCHGCGCPLSNVIPELNSLVYEHRWHEAVDLLLSTNNFPEFTSRICPALCEAACVLGINDEPVTVRQIEMAIVEKGFESGYIRPRPPAERLRERVAVIGAGPAGLSVADTLNRAGYNVVLYDKDKSAGGILRYGIPNFKLDKGIIDRRIRLMQDEGVVFELGVAVGDDVSYKYLRDRFDAICLAGGSRAPRDLKAPGRELKGIRFAMEFLVRQNRILAGEAVEADPDLDAAGKHVVILGGGDTGADCAGTAIRQKAAGVLQLEILPKPPSTRPPTTPWPMWPDILRESSSHKEGGERRWAITVKEFLGSHGHVESLKCVEVEWFTGADGRRQFREKDGSECRIKADLVLLAMGFTGPGRNRIAEDLNLKLTPAGSIMVDANHMTSKAGVFAAGDMARGQSLVVRAITDGRATAKGITSYLQTK